MNKIVALVFGICASLAACATSNNNGTRKLSLHDICPALPNAENLIPDGIRIHSDTLAYNGQLLFITAFKKSYNPFAYASAHKLLSWRLKPTR